MKKFLFAIVSLLTLVSCGSDDAESNVGTVNFSVYSYIDSPSTEKLATDSYCWFGLFDCEQSSISTEQGDVYDIADKKVLKLKDGTTVNPKYSVSTDIGTCHLDNVSYGRYTVVVCYRNGTMQTSSHYYYYGAKALKVDSPAGNNCRFVFEIGADKYGKLVNQ